MAEPKDRRSPVEPGQDRPVLAVIRRTLARGGYTVHATSLQYLVDLVDTLTAERAALRAALKEIAHGQECSNYTKGACRFDLSRTRDAWYSAIRWCDACIANDALGPQPEKTEGSVQGGGSDG